MYIRKTKNVTNSVLVTEKQFQEKKASTVQFAEIPTDVRKWPTS